MQLIDVLNICVKENASDLHLSPGLPPIIRSHGNLIHLKNMVALDADIIKSWVYLTMTKEQQQLFEKNLELDYRFHLPQLAGFRVNAFHQLYGIAAVFRLVPEKIPTFEELHFPDIIKKLLHCHHGLIVITGSTGSGKSTTLAAMVDFMNRHQALHIITIEDPIEFIHTSQKSLINQRQVHRDTHHYSSALRSALREDPDVIVVGELRDLESIRLALTAAETGHLVMATLHTSSAPRAINRIIDVFPSSEKNIIRNMLSESLQAVVCQTLVKARAGGRVAALEIMLGTPAIRNLIREDKVAQMYTTLQMGSAVGMCTFEQYLQDLVQKKLIDRLMEVEFDI